MTHFSSWRPRRLGQQIPLLLLGTLPLAAQAQTLTIQGTGGSNLTNDVTAFVDKVEIVRVSDGAVMTSALANGSFETFGGLGNGDYGFNPSGTSWTFNNRTGIETNGSAYSAPNAPDGTHGAFIQNFSGSPSNNFIAQALTLPAGTYQVRFQAAQRGCCSGVYDQGLRVLVGGVQVGAVTPTSNTSFASYTSSPFTVTASGTVATNNALAFDGSNDYVSLPTTLVAGVTNFTFETWVNYQDNGNWTRAMDFGSGSTVNMFLTPKNGDNGAPRFAITTTGGGGEERLTASSVLTSGWHHLAVTLAKSGTVVTGTLYVDGVVAATNANMTLTPSSLGTLTQNWLGRSQYPDPYLLGALDEVRFYNTALTQAQIQTDMYSTRSAASTNLLAYYSADQGTAGGTNTGITSLTDQSGNGNTGTLNGFGLSGTASNFVRSFPTITAISPASGPTATSVQVTGTNLNDATSFGFNGAAGSSSIANDFAATLTVPATATTGPVSVASATLAKYNGPLFTLASTNNALAFDGSNDYVAFPSTTTAVNNLGTSAYTLEAWVYYTGASNVNSLIRKSGDYNLYINYGRLGAEAWQLGSGNTAMTNITGSATLPTNQWTHIAATWNKATNSLKLYVNGVLDASATMGSTNAGGVENLNIGYSTAYTGQDLGGKLDEVRIYSTALTAAQVQADMFSTSASVPASLGLYLNFDQGTAGGTNTGLTTLTDQSANGYVGTLLNFALSGTTSNWVRSFPTITGITPVSGPVGTSVALTGTNLLDASSFAFNGTNASSVAVSNDFSAAVTVPSTATTGPVSLASATLAKYTGQVFTLAYPDLVISTPGYTIPNGIYNNITVASGGNGTPDGNVTVNTALVVQSGGTLADGCSLFVGSGSFTLQAGGTLNICRPRGILSGPNTALGNIGAVRLLGTRSFSPDASYVYSGGQSQDTGDGLPSQVRNFTVATSTDISLTNPLAIAQVLTLNGAGNLTTAGNALTLLSSATGSALVVNNGSGTVVGAATVQRYIDASGNTGASGYRHYSAPVSGATVASLATAGFAPVVNATYNSAANSVAVTPYPTVYGYDQSRVGSTTQGTNLSAFDQGYVSPNALGDALTVGKGYTVQIPNAALVSLTGTLNTGAQALNNLARNTNTDGGWQLIGNPYPAPLDWGSVAAGQLSNVGAAAYVFQSTGPYVGRYTSFANGVGAGTGLIATGQGFFVRATSTSTPGSIALTNANRVTTFGAAPKFQRTTAETRPLLRLSLALGTAPATVATAQDETFVYFEQGASAGFDSQYDAYKLANPSGYYLGTAAVVPAGTPELGLSIDARAPLAAAATTIPVWLSVPAGTYTLTATDLLNFATLNGGTGVYLRDALTGTLTNLATTPSYSFGVAANAPSTGRFSLVFGTATPLATTSAALSQVVASLYPNPAEAGEVALTVTGLPADVRSLDATLTDALGRPVGHYTLPATQGAARTSLPTQGLASGLYLLRLAPRDAQGAALGTLPTQRLSVR